METGYVLAVGDEARPEDLRVLGEQLGRFHAAAGCPDFRPLYVLAQGPAGMAGGLIGSTQSGWLHVEFVWVEDGRRGEGLGSRLLAAAEREAAARGACNAYLDTASAPVRGFFERRGYEVFGELPDFGPAGRGWLRKRLTSGAAEPGPAADRPA